MVEQQEFQIPQQLRELAEKNVEQARVAYGQFLDGMAEAVRAWSTVPSAVMTSGFKVVQERAIQFAKENAEAGFALASELAKAKDLQDVLRLQSNFAQMQMQSYARQAQELGQLMTEATRSGDQKAERADTGLSAGIQDRAAKAIRTARRPDGRVRAWNGS